MITTKQFAPILYTKLTELGLSMAEFEAQACLDAGSVQAFFDRPDEPMLSRNIRLLEHKLGVSFADAIDQVSPK